MVRLRDMSCGAQGAGSYLIFFVFPKLVHCRKGGATSHHLCMINARQWTADRVFVNENLT
jgi:hypothetical protein